MARKKCPACGQPYNGKRCGSCFYEPFSNEVSCDEHHKETVFDDGKIVGTAPKAQPRQTAPRQAPPRQAASRPYANTSANTRTNSGTKKKTSLPRLLRIIAIIYGIVILMNAASGLFFSGLRNSFSSFSDIFSEPEPKPEIVMPAGGTVLYDDGSLLVKADWADGDIYTDRIPVYVQNNTGLDLSVSTQDVYVNGYLLDVSYMGCDAESGDTAMSYLRLNENAMEECGIETVAEITFSLYAYDTDSYDTYTESGLITLTADTPTDFVQPVDDSGDLLWETDGIRVIYKGYQADDYSPEDFLDGTLQFFVENNTDRTMEFYIPSASVNGEPAELYFWCSLLPGTRTIADVYLTNLAEMGIEDSSQIQSLEIQLEAEDRDDWEYMLTSGAVTLDIRE